MTIQHSRKHGPFDRRYPAMRHKQRPPRSLWRPGEERTDWEGFLTQFFPGSRRHDLEALAAYESYGDPNGSVHGTRLAEARGKDEAP